MKLIIGMIAAVFITAIVVIALRPQPPMTLSQICVETIRDYLRETTGSHVDVDPADVDFERFDFEDENFEVRVDYTARNRQGVSVTGRGHCLGRVRGDPANPTARKRSYFTSIGVNGALIDQGYVDAANELMENTAY